MERRPTRFGLVVVEASSTTALDSTASKILAEVITRGQTSGIDFAVARLESVRAQEAFSRFGIMDLLRQDHLFHSVDEAVTALAGKTSRPAFEAASEWNDDR